MPIITYLDALEISEPGLGTGFVKKKGGLPPRQRSGTRTLRGEEDQAPGEPQTLPQKLAAAVDAGSILSFVDGVDAKDRPDVLFSVQFAQRAADAACDRFVQTRTWYAKFNEVLEAIGWTTEQYAFNAHQQGEGNLRMDKAALQVIAAIASLNQLRAITASIAALEKLAQDDRAITLFDRYASADLSGNFQLGAVQKSGNGALSMALGAFYFRTMARRKKFLFFQWGSNEVNFWTAAQKMTFNTAVYGSVRETIEKKLGDKAVEYIAQIEIA